MHRWQPSCKIRTGSLLAGYCRLECIQVKFRFQSKDASYFIKLRNHVEAADTVSGIEFDGEMG